MDPKVVNREILLAFWKVHILHHAQEGPLVGHWMLLELREHGYNVSPGTLYPILKRMERNGWLRCEIGSKRGPRAAKSYRLTTEGGKVLSLIRRQLRELGAEVMGKARVR